MSHDVAVPRDQHGDPDYWATVDFPALVKRFNAAQTELFHHETGWHGPALEVGALRRALDGRRLAFYGPAPVHRGRRPHRAGDLVSQLRTRPRPPGSRRCAGALPTHPRVGGP
jgi:hypothetical protein